MKQNVNFCDINLYISEAFIRNYKKVKNSDSIIIHCTLLYYMYLSAIVNELMKKNITVDIAEVVVVHKEISLSET